MKTYGTQRAVWLSWCSDGVSYSLSYKKPKGRMYNLDNENYRYYIGSYCPKHFTTITGFALQPGDPPVKIDINIELARVQK